MLLRLAMKRQWNMALLFQILEGDVLHLGIARMAIRADRQRLPDHLLRRVAEARFSETHALRQLAEQPHIRSRFAQRRDRLVRSCTK